MQLYSPPSYSRGALKTLHNARPPALRYASSAHRIATSFVWRSLPPLHRIGIISAAVLLPLCLLRDLSSLSAGSVIGTCRQDKRASSPLCLEDSPLNDHLYTLYTLEVAFSYGGGSSKHHRR